MSKLALLFPGQGSQKAGMGADLAESVPAARAVFDEADDALGIRLSKLCFEGPDEDLRLTANTQPAILTCSIATYEAAKAHGIEPSFVAGHSLGEYSALVAAGAMSFRDAVQLVRKRGQFMQEAVPAGIGAMAAILGLEAGKLVAVCEEAAQGEVVSPANYNSPGQIVIAGHTAAVERAAELSLAAGARKAVMLPVSAPFHCALMEPARERLVPELDAIKFRDLSIPLVNNVAATVVVSGDEAREGLKQQVPNPVLWDQSIAKLAGEGVESFLEVGPGRVLTGLLRSIDRTLKGSAVGDLAGLEKLSQ
jgi:[acyl-carrier-protein] S-malonyltransferase